MVSLRSRYVDFSFMTFEIPHFSGHRRRGFVVMLITQGKKAHDSQHDRLTTHAYRGLNKTKFALQICTNENAECFLQR